MIFIPPQTELDLLCCDVTNGTSILREKALLSSLNCFIEHSSGPEGADHASVTYQSSLFSRTRSCDNMATGATTSHSNLQWRGPLCSAAGGGGEGTSDSEVLL